MSSRSGLSVASPNPESRMSESPNPTVLELSLTLYPDPVLRKPTEPIERFDEELGQLVAAMFAQMAASKGVGLAAPQVGLRKRVLVVNPTGEAKDALALVNPTILSRFGPMTSFDEGCLSFPGIYAEIRRPDACRVRAYDAQGQETERDYDGFVSRIIQHEFDPLEGVLLIDRMSPADKLASKAAIESLVSRYRRRQVAADPR